MKLPKMIIFDYSQTLVHDKGINTLEGIKAVHSIVKKNPRNINPEEMSRFADELYYEIVGLNGESNLEVHNHQMMNYMYEFLEIEFDIPLQNVEQVFEENATIAEPTPNIKDFLSYLHENGIRTGVLSNMMFSGTVLSERIRRYLPDNNFEFILASSDYLYRKPDKRIFDLALRKAKLDAHDIWYCGDSVRCDIKGAQNSGIFPIYYTGTLEPNERALISNEVVTINDWLELKDKISNLLSD